MAITHTSSSPLLADTSHTDNFEARWTRWIAKGAAHDRTVERRVSIVTTLVFAGLGAWLILLWMQ